MIQQPHKKQQPATFLAKKICEILTKQRKTLSVAESCTGGLIGSHITAVAGSSGYFYGGVIAYSNTIKHEVLNIDNSILAKHGAVSSQTVAAMARGVQSLFKTDYAISISGIAGPGGGSKKKPVGLVYIGIAAGNRIITSRHIYKGNRKQVREQAACSAMLELLAETKISEEAA
jgi:nicotinamide-nucleotide amidase